DPAAGVVDDDRHLAAETERGVVGDAQGKDGGGGGIGSVAAVLQAGDAGIDRPLPPGRAGTLASRALPQSRPGGLTLLGVGRREDQEKQERGEEERTFHEDVSRVDRIIIEVMNTSPERELGSCVGTTATVGRRAFRAVRFRRGLKTAAPGRWRSGELAPGAA